jgi:hypothetical protein
MLDVVSGAEHREACYVRETEKSTGRRHCLPDALC